MEQEQPPAFRLLAVPVVVSVLLVLCLVSLKSVFDLSRCFWLVVVVVVVVFASGSVVSSTRATYCELPHAAEASSSCSMYSLWM